MANNANQADTIVVGGGLAGLTAATFLSRSGHRVTLLEKGKELGGRARTKVREGFRFNQGPHALYRRGAGLKVLRELGIPFEGGVPATTGYVVRDGQLYRQPSEPWGALTTTLLSASAKVELGRALLALFRADTHSLNHLTVQQWIEQATQNPAVRKLMQMYFRVFTYANAPTLQSAGAAIEQAKYAIAGNVLYLNGGWQTLVDTLRSAATSAGATIVPNANVVAVEPDGVRLADGSFRPARAVVIAADPHTAASLLPFEGATWAKNAVPVTAACLDLALRKLPDPRRITAFGVDRPLYFSVHSKVARLNPEGTALIHIAKYGAEDARADEEELEAMADLVQPGWRAQLVERRFLPKMIVTNRLDTAETGGLLGRPSIVVPGLPNVFLAGDWVGNEGLLADASFASAKEAARLCGAFLAQNPVPARRETKPALALVS